MHSNPCRVHEITVNVVGRCMYLLAVMAIITWNPAVKSMMSGVISRGMHNKIIM